MTNAMSMATKNQIVTASVATLLVCLFIADVSATCAFVMNSHVAELIAFYIMAPTIDSLVIIGYIVAMKPAYRLIRYDEIVLNVGRFCLAGMGVAYNSWIVARLLGLLH